MCGRQGLGKVRHLDVQELWIQQRVRNQDFDLLKVWGEENPGDLFTKAGLSESRIRELLKLLNCEFLEGRAKSAPALRQEGRQESTPAKPVECSSEEPCCEHRQACFNCTR